MPRIRLGLSDRPRRRHPDLVSELAAELKEEQGTAQPMIQELHFPQTDKVRVTVIWDKWAALPDEDRQAIISDAYEQAEGQDFLDRIALAIGLTVPEAKELGLLPFAVVPLVRKSDPVTVEECRHLMITLGASTLEGSQNPRFLFPSEEEAEKYRRRLIQALPASEPVWAILKESEPPKEAIADEP